MLVEYMKHSGINIFIYINLSNNIQHMILTTEYIIYI